MDRFAVTGKNSRADQKPSDLLLRLGGREAITSGDGFVARRDVK